MSVVVTDTVRRTARDGGQVGAWGHPPDAPDPERTFTALYRTLHPDLVRFVQRRAHPDHAEDVAAEALLVVWRRVDEVPRAHDDARARGSLSEVHQETLSSAVLDGLRAPRAAAVPGISPVAPRLRPSRALRALRPRDARHR